MTSISTPLRNGKTTAGNTEDGMNMNVCLQGIDFGRDFAGRHSSAILVERVVKDKGEGGRVVPRGQGSR